MTRTPFQRLRAAIVERCARASRPIQAAALLVALCATPIGLVAGCTSTGPTVPLPPPAALTEPDVDGVVTLTGTGATPEAIVFAFDEDSEAGVIGKADLAGAYVLRIVAQTGDTISYWQRVGTDDSPLQHAVVP
jgi:hypothetical protein